MSVAYGLSDLYEYHEFEFDSNDATTSNVLSISSKDWPLFLLGRPLNNVAGIKILEVQIPVTWYVINSQNNTFTLVENISGGSTSTVTIPAGNYNSSSLAAVLGTQMSAVSTNSVTYTVIYSGTSVSAAQTGVFTITGSTRGSAYSFTLTFGTTSVDPGWNNPRLALGFNPGSITSSSSVTPSLIAPNVALITGPNYLYISSSIIGQQTNLYLPDTANSTGTTGPQLCKVSINSSYGGIITWQDPDPQKYFNLENLFNLASIDFYLNLGNNLQTPISLNGAGFSLKLGILITKTVREEVGTSLNHQERVVKRLRHN